MSVCSKGRTPADRLFIRRSRVIVVTCLVLFLVLAQIALRLPVGPLHAIVAGFAALFFACELIAFSLFAYRLFDEFQRILLIRSFLWATAITVTLVTIWGYIELSLRGHAPHIPFLVVPAVLITLTTAAKVIVFRSHRSQPEPDEIAS